MSPPFSFPLRETSGPGEPCAVIAVEPECPSTEPRAAVLLAVRSPAHRTRKVLRLVASSFISGNSLCRALSPRPADAVKRLITIYSEYHGLRGLVNASTPVLLLSPNSTITAARRLENTAAVANSSCGRLRLL